MSTSDFQVNSNKIPVEKSFNSQKTTTASAELSTFVAIQPIPLSVEFDNAFAVPDVKGLCLLCVICH